MRHQPVDHGNRKLWSTGLEPSPVLKDFKIIHIQIKDVVSYQGSKSLVHSARTTCIHNIKQQSWELDAFTTCIKRKYWKTCDSLQIIHIHLLAISCMRNTIMKKRLTRIDKASILTKNRDRLWWNIYRRHWNVTPLGPQYRARHCRLRLTQ